MAYCNKCGAYIPDGQTKCLACGYDEAAEEKQNTAAQSRSSSAGEQDSGKYYSISNDELHRKLEDQRRKQQEQSRKWAEQEHERRRRAAEARQQEQDGQSIGYDRETFGTYETNGTQDKESRTFGALSYLSILFLLPYFLRRNDEFAMYHAKQGLVLLVFGVLSDILSAIPGIGWIFPLFRVYCIFKGMGNASKGIKAPLPYIGKYGENIRL